MKQIIFILLATVLVCVNCAKESPSDKKDDTCPNNDCNCSEDLNFDEMGPEETVCAKLLHLLGDAENRSDSVNITSPICFNVPLTKKIKIQLCLEFYDLHFDETRFHGCVKLKIDWISFHHIFNLGCLDVPVTDELRAAVTEDQKKLDRSSIPTDLSDEKNYACFNNDCHCHTYLNFNTSGPNKKICAKLSYLTEEIENSDILPSIGSAIDFTTVIARDPAPMCFNIPLWKLGKARMCLVFYDITFHAHKFHGCLKLTIDTMNFHHVVDLKCINISPPVEMRKLLASWENDIERTKSDDLAVDGETPSSVALDDSALIIKNLYANDPPPICYSVPLTDDAKAQLCLEIYDLRFQPGGLHECMRMKIRTKNFAQTVELQCSYIPIRQGLHASITEQPLKIADPNDDWPGSNNVFVEHDPSDGKSCSCSKQTCGCCKHIKIDRMKVKINGTVCADFTFLSKDLGLSMDLKWNDHVLFNKTISAKNPPPICLPIPWAPEVPAHACMQFYDLSVKPESFYGCIKFYISVYHVIHRTFDAGCILIHRKTLPAIKAEPEPLQPAVMLLPTCESLA